MPPFQHTPYDGSSRPFSVGLRPIGEEVWLEPDSLLAEHLAEKERLIGAGLDVVFRAETETQTSQREVLQRISSNLRRFHARTHRFDIEGADVRVANRDLSLTDGEPLLTAAQLIQEDLVIMRPGPEGYRLAAACLCFPSSWSLAEKFSQSMADIHKSVPGFNGTRIGRMVEKVFDNLRPEQLLCRFNWSVYPDEQLHHPEPRQLPVRPSEGLLGQLFLRVERQTLRRMPESGDILFTIKVHHDPLLALSQQENSRELADGLKRQLLELDEDQLDYKGLATSRQGLLTALEAFSD